MSTRAAQHGAQLAPEPQGGVALPPSPGKPSTFPYSTTTLTHADKIAAKFDLSIALALSSWPALTLAVQNFWGGPQTSEKRDWFAGAISDLFTTTPDADVEYLEEFLLQVMNDEFEVNVEDDSGAQVAAKIVGLRKMTSQGDFRMVDEMYALWVERQRRGGDAVKMQCVVGGEEDGDTEWDSSGDEGDGDEDGEVDMGEAPTLVKGPKEKVVPKVDDEGFTEVVGKKRR